MCCCFVKPNWVFAPFFSQKFTLIKYALSEALPQAICTVYYFYIFSCCICFKSLPQELRSCKLCLHQSRLSTLWLVVQNSCFINPSVLLILVEIKPVNEDVLHKKSLRDADCLVQWLSNFSRL